VITLSDLPGFLLVALPLVPLLAATTAAAMPRDDRLALRAVGVGALVVGVGVGIAAVVLGRVALATGGLPGPSLAPALAAAPPIRLTATVVLPVLTVLAVAPLALRAGAPRVREGMAPYVVTCLVQAAFVVGTLLLDDVVDVFAAALVASVPGFALVALFGGPERGTVTWRAAALWLVVDGLALALLLTGTPPAFLPGWFVTLALLGPGLVRLAAGPHGLWALPFCEMAPVAGAVTAASMTAPLGAVLLWRAAVVVGPGGLTDIAPPLVAILAGSVLVGGVLVTMERDLRRIAAHWIGLIGSVVALGVLAAVVEGRAPGAAIGLSCVGGLAVALLLMVVEAIERRLETRKVVQLAGLWSDAPFLAVLLPLSLMAVGGVPGPGSATVLWPTLLGLLDAPRVFAWGGVAAIAGILLGQVGAAVVVARVVLPQRRRHSRLIRVSISQGIRLAIPLLVLMLASIAAGPLSAPGTP
jgi:NADH:ubiquinone oxidoreductase subunit 4 (subunit M)